MALAKLVKKAFIILITEMVLITEMALIKTEFTVLIKRAITKDSLANMALPLALHSVKKERLVKKAFAIIIIETDQDIAVVWGTLGWLV